MLESTIENKVTKYAEKLGWLSFKFTSPSSRGVPDRIYMRDGVTFFIEYKQQGKLLRTLQQFRKKQIEQHGVSVYMVDSIAAGKRLFDEFE